MVDKTEQAVTQASCVPSDRSPDSDFSLGNPKVANLIRQNRHVNFLLRTVSWLKRTNIFRIKKVTSPSEIVSSRQMTLWEAVFGSLHSSSTTFQDECFACYNIEGLLRPRSLSRYIFDIGARTCTSDSGLNERRSI